MDLFDDAPEATIRHPVDAFKGYVERGDAKGSVAFLRSLTKAELSITLLSCGFSLTGDFKEWVDFAGAKILAAAQQRRLPREPKTLVS